MSATSVVGTFETCQQALGMSAYQGKTGSDRYTVKTSRIT